ncbi:NAD(P)H-dependent FMN reductase [Chitinophaga niastensis]|uniref:NAD(P)H-dependent FMN reductase n=1 Tax=Chitinophaga niastensis TaxID=536980 RepID=A0A2P8HGJ5_CHINA|nr:NAD(P)H-dependent oxidoreductase [Chitinophaga niastensis]PSL45339.1 NAD(P)H-dependent FMN reductase [Chitinophaga niastensis]
MTDKIKILAISGSTRKSSSNHLLIKAIADLAADKFEVSLFEGLTDIPHFNPDLDNGNAPAQVVDFRKQLDAADAILICTPEYAIGVPGTLKNAVDWTVSSMQFSKKPVALVTAGTSGFKAHQSLLGTLLIIEAKITNETQLVISGVKTKMNEQGIITNEETLDGVNKLIASLAGIVDNSVTELLPAPTLF